MKLYLKVVFFSLGMLLVNGCGELSGTRTLRLAHGLDVNHSVHKAMVKMGEDLKRVSGGKMRLEIYPNQQLGTERQCLELLQIGSLDMTKVSVGTLENFAPKMKVLGLPFLFRDRQHSFDVLDGPIGQELLNDGEQYWLKGLGYYDAGSRSFYTKDRPINSPEDLEGLKIRVMESVTAMDMVKDLGGSPTPISWGELYTALQQGVVDGAENNPPSFYLSRHYEVCKFYTLDEHTVLPDVLLAGTHLWDSLSEEEQGWLKQAVDGSIGYQRKLWAESEEEALAEVEKAGVEIIRPDKSLFSEKIKDSFDKYKDDEAMYKLIQEIQATK
ncbi:TRAP transporter substrate-binding protein [Zobellia galactanivorans]|uniref:TRAP transporter, substrate-binding periplasmic subunit n=1 Tax=Zobellia galactanivorans (strain DSM 12802 / CCUG 47099 / CIP 106680 / NCIMB 13871 / Dsij) TaxID=63186 RepID=G0L4C8_ZOBGA|nr:MULTISPECIES: TRAP transporter substrate-binding protein [Zobellia]MBU3026832.1 TRAP transporter substrate-binding protein [Zobellia galactanivorans]MDO6810904.1 TRAP transporter substrate-binding protein [Zobellia galactanivorans]OWW26675.1 C4-dicarboxylate ABC transporter substrate-binding protein [Zobellia sp. OII3]CAZ95631.1 TRAP transporter, substrate-binding periplasmic subunit [Zobellia galactanivorans]